MTQPGPFADSRWPLVALGRLYDVRLGKMLQTSPSSDADREVSYLKAGLLGWDGILAEELPTMWASPSDVAQLEISPGDLMVAEGGDSGRATLLTEAPDDQVIFQNSLHRIRSRDDRPPRYLYYVLSAIHSSGWLEVATNKATIGHLTGEKLKALRIPDLPVREQQAIADFLDRETIRIDTLMTKKGRLKRILHDRQRALADYQLRQTGRHRIRVRSLARAITSGPRGWSQYFAEEGVPFLRISNLSADSIFLTLDDLLCVDPPVGPEAERTRARTGDVLVSITADIGRVAIVRDDIDTCHISQHLALLRPDPGLVNPEWLALSVFGSDSQAQLDASRYGGTKTQLSLDDVANVRLPYASLKMQAALIAEWREKAATIDSTIRALELQLQLLGERRRAIISSAFANPRDGG